MKIGIGTVQLGLDYGISNRGGQTPAAEAADILAAAQEYGIDLLDTAYQYGTSEAVLGSVAESAPFRIVTKTPSFAGRAIAPADATSLRDAFQESLDRLRRSRVYGLLAHNAEALLAEGSGCLLDALRALKEEGRVEKIGVSVYTEEELEALLGMFTPDIVQLPLNVFDQRFLKRGSLRHLKALGTEIHVRSVFLQGLLVMEPAALPAFFAPVRPLLERFIAHARHARMSPAQAALYFIHRIPEVDYAIIGLNNREQLRENMASMKGLEAADGGEFSEFALEERKYLMPNLWETK